MCGFGVSEVWGRLSMGAEIPPLPVGPLPSAPPLYPVPSTLPHLVGTAALLPILLLSWGTGGASPLCSGKKRAPAPPQARSDTSVKGIRTYTQHG